MTEILAPMNSTKSVEARRKRWLTRTWHIRDNIKQFVEIGPFEVGVYPIDDHWWSGWIKDKRTRRFYEARFRYSSSEAAKRAAFEGLIVARRLWRKE